MKHLIKSTSWLIKVILKFLNHSRKDLVRIFIIINIRLSFKNFDCCKFFLKNERYKYLLLNFETIYTMQLPIFTVNICRYTSIESF